MKYLLLQNPGHNRVYYNLADKLALAELTVASSRFSVACQAIEIVQVEGIRYLSIETESAIKESDLEIISRLSFVFAIYQLEEVNGQQYLKPIQRVNYEFLDSKISSLLKYRGKTNELFTKMMLNVALLSSKFSYSDPIQLLDPVAGKGTTLFEAAIYGYDTYGIEIEPKPVHELVVFFKKFLEEERFKHTLNKRQISGQKKSDATHIQEFDFARSKADFKSGKEVKKLAIVGGNSDSAAQYFKGEKFHLIVGDLPYGIQHGNNSDKKAVTGSRNPSELLAECLPGWHQVLKKGGIVVMAWNSFLVSRQKLSEVFTDLQFEILSQEPYSDFEHMVDRSIKRDIVVARK